MSETCPPTCNIPPPNARRTRMKSCHSRNWSAAPFSVPCAKRAATSSPQRACLALERPLSIASSSSTTSGLPSSKYKKASPHGWALKMSHWLVKQTCERFLNLLLGKPEVVLLGLAIESGLSNAKHARCGELVAARFAQGTENGAALQFLEWQDFILVRRAFGGGILQVGGQVSDMKDRAGTQLDSSLDGVFQLAHVSRPIVGDQAAHGVFGDGTHRSLRIGEFLQKCRHQNGDIALAVSKRRQFDLHHVQPEIQILAESSRANGSLEIAVGGSDDTHVDVPVFRGANGLDLPLLQGPQELGLEVHGHVSNFVEKERAPLSGFEQSLLGLHCSGERALDVTEKLGFDQRGHQCGAVHGRKRPLTARPGKMNAARHELFPRSTFPEDENWVLVLAHFLDHLVDALHFHRDADQPAEPRTRPQLLAEQPVLLLQVNCFGHAFEAGAQLRNAERFRHIVHGAQAGDLDCRFDRSVLR